MTRKTPRLIILSLLFAALLLSGSWLAHYLLDRHVALAYGSSVEDSLCAIGSTFDCDAVAGSDWAELLGVPWAGLGLGYYLVIGLGALGSIFFPSFASALLALLLLITSAALLTAPLLIAVMAWELKTYCLFCLFMHAVDLGLVFVLLMLLGGPAKGLAAIRNLLSWRQPAPVSQPALPRNKIFLLFAVMAAMVLYGAAIALPASKALGHLEKERSAMMRIAVDQLRRETPVELPLDSLALLAGKAENPLSMVVFSDLQCPFCRATAKRIGLVLGSQPRKIAVYFANYPLSTACNSDLPRDLHPYACFAAKAAICAQQFGVFSSFHDRVFDEQPSLFSKEGSVEERLANLASELGISRQDFDSCLQAPKTEQTLAQHIALGKSLGIEGTPAVFVGGRKLKAKLTLPLLRALSAGW